MALPAQFDHPSFTTAFGTVFGYVLILVAMTILLFGVPYAVFLLL